MSSRPFPRLYFPPTVEITGRPFSISNYTDASPETPLRELIQNSLDAHAASGMSDQSPCEVHIRLDKLKTAIIPGIEDYRAALEDCVRTWKEKTETKRYLEEIGEYAREDTIDVLHVRDNGIGFVESSMNAVLAEGAPNKQEGASGSFGIGHLTAFGMSGLQYILYSSKYFANQHMFSGHAVLAASQNKSQEKFSPDGYYLKGIDSDFWNPYKFCDGKEIPKFIKNELDKLETTGSMITILGFNHFRDFDNSNAATEKLHQQILEVLANSFVIAILSGQLRVTIQLYENEEKILSIESIDQFLKDSTGPERRKKEQKRAQEILDIMEAFTSSSSKKGKLETPFGDTDLILKNKTNTHSISIWRNGMLITKSDIRLARNKFVGKVYFNCIVQLSGKKTPKTAHDLVKAAETPEHNQINKKRLNNDRKKIQQLVNFFNILVEWIRENSDDLNEDFFDLDDILLNAGTTVEPRASRKLPKPSDDDEPGPGPGLVGPGDKPRVGPGGDKPRVRRGGQGQGTSPRKTKFVKIKAQGKFVQEQKENFYRLKIIPDTYVARAVLQLVIDTGQDDSCFGSLIPEDDIRVEKIIDSSEKVEFDDGEIIVKQLKKDAQLLMDLKLNIPENFIKSVSIDCLLIEVTK